jgi:ABC-type antimicrobial peptide transport system permease subunit
MKQSQPPKLARALFEWYCGHAKVEDLVGDLDEKYYLYLESNSPFRAKLKYCRDVVSLLFSYAIRKRKREASTGSYSTSNFSLDMLQNYIKVAVRNLYQHKYFSTLNVFGLAVGMSVSLLLISMVSYIKTYDNFHVNRDNIYTIVTTRHEGIEESEYASAPIVLADKLKDYPEIKEVVRIQSGFNEEIKMQLGDIPLRGYYVEPNFFSVFTYNILRGDGGNALTKPNSVIITESAALKIFNSTDVVGKTLELKQGGLLEISALMKDHPINSHLKFEVLVSYSTLPAIQKSTNDQWTKYRNQYLYTLLVDGAKPSKLNDYLTNVSNLQYAQSAIKVDFATEHIDGITMGPDYNNAIGPKWDMLGVIVFGIVAALILLPACFNYTNLSIARALKRSKEIGLRKTMGGVKNQIFFQFITETVVITLIALAGAVLIFFIIRKEFQTMMVASSSLDLSLTPFTLLLFFAFAVGTGLVAGVFPALYFARLNPIQALKTKISGKGSAGMRIRKGLTVFQFALSFCFILSLVVFSRQYKYSLNFDFGFAKQNMVDLQLQGVKSELVKAEFANLSTVQTVSMSSSLLGLNYSETWIKNNEKDSTEVAQVFVDTQYIPNFGLQFLAGKNFPEEAWRHERFIIVNEEFLKAYKINSPAEAIGRTYNVEGKDLEIIGVLKNFHFATLRLPIGKFFFRMDPAQFAYANLKVSSKDAYTMFSQFEQTWKSVSPLRLEAQFFEEELNEGYKMYQVLLKMVGFLGLLAITISLLGMLGMVVYTSEGKIKEVSIRKVMGASTSSITYLLSKDYFKLMLWAIVLSIPLTVVFFDKFLTQLQYYSVQLTVWDVLLSSAFLLALGIATIASQTVKTANANPAETLKME